MRARLMLLAGLLVGGVPGCRHAVGESGTSTLAFGAPDGHPTAAAAVLSGPGADALRARFGGDATAADVEEVFALYLVPAGSGTAPQDAAGRLTPLLADLSLRPGRAVLRPRAPLTRGLVYEARFDGLALSPPQSLLTTRYAPPRHAGPSPAAVTGVYPAFPVVPANTFRFYLWFSEPMAQGRVFEHVRLLNEAGEPLPMAFHEVELWDPEHRRLTLWISPGRTKSALGITAAAGHVLDPDRRYTLEVAAGLPDRQGRALGRPFRHSFRTARRDDTQPDMARWKLALPGAGSVAPLGVTFDEPLDRPLVAASLAVLGPGGEPIEGAGETADDGRSWRFTPRAPWAAGAYRLAARGDLDDLAGNSLHRRFEAPAGETARPAVEPPLFERRFRIAP